MFFFPVFLGLPVGICLAFGIGRGWDLFGFFWAVFLHGFGISLGFFVFLGHFSGIFLPSGVPQFSNVLSLCFV